MCQPYIESATALSVYYYYYYIDDEEPQEFPVFVGLRKGTSRAWLDPEM